MIAWKNNGDSGKKETHKMEGGHKKNKKNSTLIILNNLEKTRRMRLMNDENTARSILKQMSKQR